MRIADVVATRSTCPRRQVGAVLVNEANRVIATGFNGSPSGFPHCDEVGCEMANGHCVRTVHAEENAILQVALSYGASTILSTCYTTASPCYNCFKRFIQCGIKRVVAREVYDNSVVARSKSSGIDLVLLPKEA